MADLVIDKIKVFKQAVGSDIPQVADSGQLVVEGGVLEFRGKKGSLKLDPVRNIEVQGNVRVDFGEGEDLRSVTLGDFRRGGFRTRSQNRALAEELRSALQLKPMTERESGVAKGRDTALAVAAYRKGRNQMWIGGGAAVVGTIATVVGMTAAEGGGSYFVFWGAIVFGALIFIQGLADYRKNREIAAPILAADAIQVPSGKGLNIERLKADGDTAGLIEGLWVDEFDIRARAMDALAELRDPTVTDQIVAALGHERWDVRWSAAETLGKLGDPRGVEPLRGALGDENALVRAAAEQSIKNLEAEHA